MVWKLRIDPKGPLATPRVPNLPSLPKIPRMPKLPELPKPPKPAEVPGYKWYWSEPSRGNRKR